MNTSQTSGPSRTVSIEVADFAEAVRAQLADLSVEVQEELVGGLEADLADLVAEQGPGALGDPVAYARELRGAAGLSPEMGWPLNLVERPPLGKRVGAWLDAAKGRWTDAVSGLPGRPWEFLVTLRPVWWVTRAFVAAFIVSRILGDQNPLGRLLQHGFFFTALVALCAFLSVQLGRGELIPRRFLGRAGPRSFLIGLNLVAALLIGPVVLTLPSLTYSSFDPSYGGQTFFGPGLAHDGVPVSNVFAFDAEGKPLVGVQLFDQDGKPLNVQEDAGLATGGGWTFAWTSAYGQVWNVFPLAEFGSLDTWDGGARPGPSDPDFHPTMPAAPQVVVPQVTSPGRLVEDAATEAAKEEVDDENKENKQNREQRGAHGERTGSARR